MFPGINPKKMQQMMRQMGIQQVEIPATEVIIRLAEKDLIINNPSVQKVNMMGQETFQISGHYEERKREESAVAEISEEDINTVMEQAKVDKETAKEALEEAGGDLAEAILNLKKEE